MPVVPIRPDGPVPGQPMLKPPDPTFLMMAAAQMHSEGRLVKPHEPYIPSTTRGGTDATPFETEPPRTYTPSSGQRTGPSMMAQNDQTPALTIPESLLGASKLGERGDYINSQLAKKLKKGDQFKLPQIDNETYEYLGHGQGGDNDYIRVEPPKKSRTNLVS